MSWQQETLVQATVTSGSDHPGVFRQGTPVEIALDESRGELVVTRGGGALKVAIVTGPDVDALRRLIGGGTLRGTIVGSQRPSSNTIISIRLASAQPR